MIIMQKCTTICHNKSQITKFQFLVQSFFGCSKFQCFQIDFFSRKKTFQTIGGNGRLIPFASLIILHFDLSMHDISNAIKTFISFTLFLSVKHGAIQTCSSAVSNSTSILKLNHFLSYRFRYQAIIVVVRNHPMFTLFFLL